MNLEKAASKIINKLGECVTRVEKPSTGSVYIYTSNPKVKYIRVANHTGHKVKPKTWQLRCDVMSSRKGTNRIYNDSLALIRDFNSLT